MNHFDGYAKPHTGGFVAMIRTAKDGEAKPVLTKGGKKKIYPSELEAWRAVANSLLAYFNGHEFYSGHVAGKVKEAADALFPKLVRQRGKSKAIQVERKGRRRERS